MGSMEKEIHSGVKKLAGNEKSGNVIPFRMKENELEQKIKSFREEYGDGSKGMVTWERFCAYLGYSLEEVKECYQRGKEQGSAYGGRSKLIEKFYTECQAMMIETCGQNRALAGKLAERDLIRDRDKQDNNKTFVIQFGNGDKRSEQARK